MDTREEAIRLGKEVIKELLEFGTSLDEHYRKFRELRLLEDSLSFQSALLNVEHAFFMTINSINVLKEQIRLLEIAAKKKEIE